MRQERLPKLILYAQVNGKRAVGRLQNVWIIYRGSWLEPFGTSSKCNAVCVGGPRAVAASPGDTAPATLKEKREKRIIAYFRKCFPY